MLEWQKLERNAVPWQLTFFKEDGTHRDSEWLYFGCKLVEFLFYKVVIWLHFGWKPEVGLMLENDI